MTRIPTILASSVISAAVLLAGCATTVSDHEAKYKDLNIDDLLNRGTVSAPNKQLLQTSLVERAKADNLAGDTSSAVKHAEMALKFAPDARDAKLVIAESRLQQGRFEVSERLFSDLQSAMPSDIAHQGYGLSLLGQNKHNEAQPWLTKAVVSNAALWRSWNGLGIIYDRSSDWESSEKSYLAGIDAAADKSVLHSNLGLSYLQQNRLADAISSFENARALSNDSRVDLNYRTALALTGNTEMAERGASDLELAYLYNSLGTKALEAGQNEKAIRLFKSAINKSPSYFSKAILNLDRAQTALP